MESVVATVTQNRQVAEFVAPTLLQRFDVMDVEIGSTLPVAAITVPASVLIAPEGLFAFSLPFRPATHLTRRLCC
jgi:hypothetical protein